MKISSEFLKAVLNTITAEIVVIDQEGYIQFVNKDWGDFGKKNTCIPTIRWNGINYLKVCDDAAAMGDEFGLQAAEGIRKVIARTLPDFYCEYPCHSPDQKRWFMMRMAPFKVKDQSFYLIKHQEITERKLIEEKIELLSRIDGLTGIPNRRSFDEFLHSEWARCKRLRMPLTLALIDLDHFKLINDTYGHMAGDAALRQIGGLLTQVTSRPSDLCGRYGGEEFGIILGNTTLEKSLPLLAKVTRMIKELRIANEAAPTTPFLTVSIGVATVVPDRGLRVEDLLKTADERLYAAKRRGRDQIVTEGYQEAHMAGVTGINA